MPILPPTGPTVYDTWSDMLQAARFRLGQTKMPSLFPYLGSILDATEASTQQACKNGYRRFQDDMCANGSKRFQQSIVIEGIPATASTDPASESYISWFGCSDGVNTQTTPALPDDLVTPLWMSERISGQNASFPPPNYPNMNMLPDGITKRQKLPMNGCWQWRNDAIYFPGATGVNDFWIYYQSYLPDPANVGSTRWFNTQVPVMRCQDPLAWWISREFAMAMASDPRTIDKAGAMALVSLCESNAAAATKRLLNREVAQDQRADVRRKPYGGGRGR